MGEVLGTGLTTLWGFWGLFLSMPLLFHLLCSLPVGVFLVYRAVILVVGLIGSRDIGIVKEEAKMEERVDVRSLVGTMVATVVAVNLVGALGEKVMEEVTTMPNQLVQKKSRPQLEKSIPEKPLDVVITERRLKEGFEKASSEKGLKYLSRLETEYKGLRKVLDRSRVEETVLNLKRVTKLTGSLYQKGLSFLTQALNVTEQMSTSSREALQEECEELKTELSKLSPASTLYKMVEERLDNNAKALKTVKGYSEKLDEYFCQVGLCRDSIREIRLGIPELLGNIPKEEFNKVLLELRTRIELAQRVQAEYDKQGI